MNETYQPQPAVNQTNGLGLAGFIVSLVSLVGCGGILSPISLIMCLIALAKPPKGFAIAGLVLSLIGSLGFVLLFFVIGIGALFAVLGLGIAVAVMALVAAVGQNAAEIVESVQEYHEANGRVPASLVELGMSEDQLTDTWGNRFIYVPGTDGDEFVLVSAGPDEEYGNSDDYVGRLNAAEWANVHIGQGYTKLQSEGWTNLRERVIAESEVPPVSAPEDDAEVIGEGEPQE